MAQSANNFIIEQQQGSLHNSLRNLLISLKINTVEQFFLREKTEIKKEIHQIHVNILASDVDGRLATSIWPMLSLYRSGCFEHFEPLIRVILADAPKTDQEMYELIEEQFNDFPSHPPVVSAGLVNSSTLRRHFFLLKHELKDRMYKDVPGLVKRFIQQHHYDPDLLMEPLEPFIDIKLKETVTDTSEKPMLKWLTSLVEHCSTWSNKRTNCQPPRTWRSCPDANLEGAVAQRKMDGAIMLRSSEDRYHIADVMVPFELKKNSSEIKDAALCLAKHVYEVFGSQHTRQYVIETKENLNKFVALILLFLTATNEVLGFDPTTHNRLQHLPSFGNLRTWDNVLASTSLWRQAAKILGQRFMATPTPQRRSDMLRDVTVQNIPHLARYHHHEDVYVANQLVDIEPHVRGGINYRSGQKFQSSDVSADSQEPTDFTDRVHRRSFVGGYRGCIKGHWALLRAGYLHRDISINNLMIDNQTKDPDRKSFLIDLDMAIPYPLPNNEDHHERAGTKKRARPPGYDWNEHEPKALAAMKAGYLHYPKDLTDDSRLNTNLNLSSIVSTKFYFVCTFHLAEYLDMAIVLSHFLKLGFNGEGGLMRHDACAYPTEFEFLIFACYPLIVFCSSYALMLDIVVKSFHAATRMTRPNGTKPEHYELKRPHESLGLPFRCPVPNSSLLSKGPDGILKIETNGIHSSSSGPLARPGIDQVELQAAPTGDTIGSRAIASSPIFIHGQDLE
ncbi:hypothetical protein KEM48_010514 [Puccinia striiformis f. sp. tritici PST-130]|nr:hypothetical protein KEM48_010514 [Puccinia striiformis f. sp. tritici PST-130]